MTNTAISTEIDPMQEERLQKLREYNASEHLKKWTAFNSSTGLNETVIYYPAAWRLYELSLKYPTANFKVEIVHMDPAKDFVVLKSYLFFGEIYEKSPKRAEALKQGRLSKLDKIETNAKARCARDFGIGTEHALDMDEASDEVGGTVVSGSLASNGQGVINLANSQQRQNIQKLCVVLGRECPNFEGMSFEDAGVMLKGLAEKAKEQAAQQQQQKREAKQNVRVVPSEPPAEDPSTEKQPSEEKPVTPQPPTVSEVRARVALVKPANSQGLMTFEQYYRSTCQKKYISDDAISPEDCIKMWQALDSLEHTRAENARKAQEQGQLPVAS
jgi:hypothetical protein